MDLVLDSLQYRAGRKEFNYNAHVKSGITGIIGDSGAGKTTLLKIISGIAKPYFGRLTLNGKVLFDTQRKISVPVHKRNIGMVFQQNYLFPHMNIVNNLIYSRGQHFHRNSSDFDEIVDLLSIGHLFTKKPRDLSGGECQRVAIGRALLQKPDLLLLDEPFSNLDKVRRYRIISYLLSINSRFSVPLMIVSHDWEDVSKLTDVILSVENGSIRHAGPTANRYGCRAPDGMAWHDSISAPPCAATR